MLIDISIKCGLNKKATASLEIKVDKNRLKVDSSGTGPIDAVFKAIKTTKVMQI